MIWKKQQNCSMVNCHSLKKNWKHEEENVKNRDLSLVHESVSEEEIARIISRWTGIPVAKLTESETKQDTCIWMRNCTNVSSDRMKVSQKLLKRSSVPKPESKIRQSRSVRSCSLGPTGVGKTELAKALSCKPV